MSNTVRLGIAGLGTVGAALVHIVQRKANQMIAGSDVELSISAVSARSRDKDRGFSTDGMIWFDDPVALAKSDDVDLFVELIGGDEGPARDSVVAALKAGKSVVTANKALLAKHGVELAELAEENNVSLNYEAAVAGGIPIIKTMRESLAGNEIRRVFGIMNGTCNYILTRMEADEISFEDCLADAQKLGYAEADPTFDIGGHDTAHKLAILTSLAFGTQVSFDAIYLEGIEKITLEDIKAADKLGYRIKLLGVAQITDSGIEQRVHPAMVPASSAIAQIDGVTNAVTVETDLLGSIMLSGPGAGGDATASAVAGDIADIARGTALPVFGKPASSLQSYERARMRRHEGGYYIALNLHDRSGAFASIANRMAECEISLQSVVQHENSGDVDADDGAKAKPVIIITHETNEKAVADALSLIKQDGNVVGEPKMIRIETLS